MKPYEIGFEACANAIGRGFFEEHRRDSLFSHEDKGVRGTFCFLGIDLHPEARVPTIRASLSDWDVYASCFVKNGVAEMDRCRLPKE